MKITVLLIISCFIAMSCGTNSAPKFDSVNSKVQQFPVKELQVGKTYKFVLVQKEDEGRKGKSDIEILGDVVEINKESGWIKVQNRSGNFDFVHFKDIERFTEYTDKISSPTNSNVELDESQRKSNQDSDKAIVPLKNSSPKTPYKIDMEAANAAAKSYKQKLKERSQNSSDNTH